MTPDGAPLAHRAAWGFVWALVATVAARAVTLAGLAVLARLLSPVDFGLLAFALVFITYVDTVGDLGTGVALIQRADRVEEAAELTFIVNLAMGLVWLGLTLLLAPAVAGFFRAAQGAEILRALAWSFPLKALGNTHDALCQRELGFKRRLIPEVALAAVKATLSIALAVAGFGVWSLVVGQLGGLVAWTALLWLVVPWRPSGRVARDLLWPLLRYGRAIVAVNVMAAIVHHADLVVVGRVLGAGALGLYQMAGKVPEMTIIVVMWVTSRVLFPSFARLAAGGGTLQRPFLLALRYLSLLSLPAATALVALAEPLVLTLFGPQWRGAVPLLRVLAIYAALRASGAQAGDILKATGRPGWLAALGAARALVLLPLLVVAAPGGTLAVALALSTMTALSALVNLGLACRVTRTMPREVARALRPAFLASALVGAVLLALAAVTAAAPPPARLGIGLVGAIAALAAGLWLFSPETYAQAREALRRAAPAPLAPLESV